MSALPSGGKYNPHGVRGMGRAITSALNATPLPAGPRPAHLYFPTKAIIADLLRKSAELHLIKYGEMSPIWPKHDPILGSLTGVINSISAIEPCIPASRFKWIDLLQHAPIHSPYA